ncbi:MAG TPA: GNAT family N-acetyltransferase [Vicinamibacterales bacterium]|nr:GNAT family N-acetyltransferase [Vicinamibacterales bacterium]
MAIVKNRSARRFEVEEVPGAFLQFAESPGRIRLIHTEVPDRARGHGWASALAKFALDEARDRQLRVDAQCPFVQSYLQRHPEYTPLLDPSHHHTPAEERRNREAALDDTIAASFPASDPPSSDPNPDDDDAAR